MTGNERRRLTQEVRDLKEDRPCDDCGRWFPHYVMDFDHRDPETKTLSVSAFLKVAHNPKEIWDEIDLCDLVCSNCHRIRTNWDGEYDDRIREYQDPDLYWQVREFTG